MKRITSLLLAAVAVMALAGCGSSENDKTDTATPATSGTPTTAGEASAPADDVTAELTDDMKKELTPEGAKVITNEAYQMTMESSMNIDELKTFYEEAGKKLGATEEGFADQAVGWKYDAQLNGKGITVLAMPQGDITNISILY